MSRRVRACPRVSTVSTVVNGLSADVQGCRCVSTVVDGLSTDVHECPRMPTNVHGCPRMEVDSVRLPTGCTRVSTIDGHFYGWQCTVHGCPPTVHENPLMFTDVHGHVHGCSWKVHACQRTLYGLSTSAEGYPRVSTVVHSCPWTVNGCPPTVHEYPRTSVVVHGCPRVSMGVYGCPRVSKGDPRFPGLSTTDENGLSTGANRLSTDVNGVWAATVAIDISTGVHGCAWAYPRVSTGMSTGVHECAVHGCQRTVC